MSWHSRWNRQQFCPYYKIVSNQKVVYDEGWSCFVRLFLTWANMLLFLPIIPTLFHLKDGEG